MSQEASAVFLTPPPSVQHIIEYFWRIRRSASAAAPVPLFADHRADLVVDLLGTGGFGPSRQPGVAVAGAFSRPGALPGRVALDLLGMRFRTGCAPALGTPGGVFANRSLCADLVMPGGVTRRFLDQCLAAAMRGDSAEPLRLLAAFAVELIEGVSGVGEPCIVTGLSYGA